MTTSGTPQMPRLLQNDGRRIPQLGLGIYGPADAETATTVESALALGYRLIDTAALYANERGAGEGIRCSAVAREDVYVTTKLADDRHGYDEALIAFEMLDESDHAMIRTLENGVRTGDDPDLYN